MQFVVEAMAIHDRWPARGGTKTAAAQEFVGVVTQMTSTVPREVCG